MYFLICSFLSDCLGIIYVLLPSDFNGFLFLFSCFLFIYFIVVQLQLSPFLPFLSPALPPQPPTFNPTPPPVVFKKKFYCYSITVVCFFSPSLHPCCLSPWVLYTCSLTILSLLSPIIPLLPPLWLLLVCSLFQCLWLYFACLFVLLVRFHL